MVRSSSTFLVATVAFGAASTFAAPVVNTPTNLGVTARESESHELAARQFGFLSAIGDIAQDTAKSGAKVAGGAGRSRLPMAKGEAKTEKKNLKHQQPVGQVLMGGFATRELYGMSERDYENGMIYVREYNLDELD